MLEEIVDAKNDSEILSFFLASPPRSFSIIEVSKRLGVPFQKAVNILNKLVTAGVLKNFSKKGKKYYLLDQRYKLLPALKTYWLKNGPKYHDELFTAIRQLGEVKAAFLSGIFCALPELPVDVLLVGRVNLNKLSDFLKAAEKMMGQEINYSVMSVDEFQLRRDTFDRFIKDIFDYPHLTVVDDLEKVKKA